MRHRRAERCLIDGGVMLFDGVLMADRGEMACRITSAAYGPDLRSIAVSSDAGCQANIGMADDAYCLNGSSVRESYLDIDGMLNITHQSGVPAAHPPYALLSENVDLTRHVKQINLAFVALIPNQSEEFGAKDSFRTLTKTRTFPCSPARRCLRT